MHRITTGALLRALGGNGRRLSDRIVACLALSQDRSVPRRDLIDFVWGDDPEGGPLIDSLDVLIHRLRRRGTPIKNRVRFGWAISRGPLS